MDWTLILKYGPLIAQYAPDVIRLWNEAVSNDDFTTKLNKTIPTLGGLITGISSYFPDGQSANVKAVGAVLTIFSTDIVKMVQGACNTFGGANLIVDGIYGDLTRAAVKDLQTKFGLVADGIAGKVTQALINMLVNKAKLPATV